MNACCGYQLSVRFHQFGSDGHGQPSEYARESSFHALPVKFACEVEIGISDDAMKARRSKSRLTRILASWVARAAARE